LINLVKYCVISRDRRPGEQKLNHTTSIMWN